VLILGFAFHWQATRAREADLIHDTVRSRIDTALNRGRCGLWDWDLASGRVFWSHSMFDILGLEAKDDLLTFGEVDALVRAEVEQGRRAYYVVLVIDDQDANSVAAVARRLSEGALRGVRIGTLHGRMQAPAKERVMREFRAGALDVLVATTVVEVGIDVPEATIIVVVAAERYGLAQLHQLRGRVGRGATPSRCCLVVSPGSSAQAMARLDLLARNPDGAEVAQADLAIRGPGDLLGARQSGTLPLRFARFIRSADLIERAGDMAEEWLRRDPQLASSASANARAAISRMLDWGFSLGDVG